MKKVQIAFRIEPKIKEKLDKIVKELENLNVSRSEVIQTVLEEALVISVRDIDEFLVAYKKRLKEEEVPQISIEGKDSGLRELMLYDQNGEPILRLRYDKDWAYFNHELVSPLSCKRIEIRRLEKDKGD